MIAYINAKKKKRKNEEKRKCISKKYLTYIMAYVTDYSFKY